MILTGCPKCHSRLYGGPVRFTCMNGHGASAADLYYERDTFTDLQAEREARQARRYGRAS